MGNREREILLGAVIFFSVVILVVGTLWLSDRYAGAAGGYRLHVKFDRVPGLQVGNPVTFRGVRVGKVLAIFLDEGRPVAALGFSEVADLPVDSRFLLKSDGLLGGQMIEVHLGQSEQHLADGAVVHGISDSGLDAVVAQGEQTIEHLRGAIDSIASADNLAHLNSMLARVDTTTRHLNRLLSDPKLEAMIDSLALAADDTRALMRDNRETLTLAVTDLAATLATLARVSAQVETTAVALQKTFANLDTISAQIRAGHGTVGRLVHDDAVYEHLGRTLTSVDSLVEDIRRNPKRYFSFSVF